MDSFAKRLRRYALSIGLVAAATAASMLFAPAVAGARAELFVAAVFLSTWFGGGISGGLLATVVGAVIYDYYFVDSHFSFAIETPQGAGSLGGFLAVSLLIAFLTASLRRRLARERAVTQDLARREAQFRALHDIAVAATGVLDPEPLAQLVADRACALAGADMAVLAWWDPDVGALRVLADAPIPQGERPRSADTGLRGYVFQHGTPLVVADYAGWEGAVPELVAAGIRSAAGVPLQVQERTLGVLIAGSRVPDRFEEATTDLLALLAAYVTPALLAAGRYGAAEQGRALNLALAELVREAAIRPDPEHVLGLVSDAGMALLGADYAMARLLEEGDQLTIRGVRGTRADWSQRRVSAGVGVLTEAVRERRTVVRAQLDQLSEEALRGLHTHRAEGAHTLLCTPLFVGERAVGGLIVGWRHDHVPAPAELARAETLAHFAAGVVENANAHEAATRHAQEAATQAAALAQANARLQTIYDAIGCGIIVRDAAGRLTHANATAAQLTGLGEGPLRALGAAPPWETLAIDGQPPISGHRWLHGGRPPRQPLRNRAFHVRLASGALRWFRVDRIPLEDAQDALQEVVFSFVDITDVKEAERQLAAQATILQNISEAVIVLDLAGTIQYWNAGAEALFGYEADEMLGRSAAALFPDPQELPTGPERARRSFVGEWQGRRKDGSLVWAEVHRAPLRDGAGEPHGVVAIVSDLTAQKRLEQELLQAQRLETAGRLAGQVAHDFNNLLAPLRGYPELIKLRLPAGHPAGAFCDQMIQAAQRMAEINEDLLALGQHGHVEHIPLELAELVRQTISALDLPATVHLEVDLGPEPLTVSGSAGQVQRVLTNLVLNARDALEGHGQITVRLERCHVATPIGRKTLVPPGDYAQLTVADTGPGIPPAVQERMFDAFFTTKAGGTRRGSGLGLSIVQTVVAEHQGVLDFMTAPGEGTRFVVYLPLLDAAATLPEPPAPPRGHERLLVVDDDPVQRGLMREFLVELGYAVETASSGEEALVQAEAHPPALVILDMLLGPGIDGAETYRRLRAHHPTPRAVLLSGFVESDRVRLAQSLGAGPYLRKPVALNHLALVLRQELDGPEVSPLPS